RGRGDVELPRRLGVRQRRGVAGNDRILADELQRLRRLRGLLQRNQRRQRVIGLELLLDAGELDELLGELVCVERVERVLILKLGRQQREEGLEIAGDGLIGIPAQARGAGRRGCRQRRAARNDRRVCGCACACHVTLLRL